ncbi:MAG: zinc ribbon domain-containing protein [Patescibacteria group bacterium]
MALIKCSECGNEISDKALMCPHCGNPADTKQVLATDTPPSFLATTKEAEVGKRRRWIPSNRLVWISAITTGAFVVLILLFLLVAHIQPTNPFIQKTEKVVDFFYGIIQPVQNIPNFITESISRIQEVGGTKDQQVTQIREKTVYSPASDIINAIKIVLTNLFESEKQIDVLSGKEEIVQPSQQKLIQQKPVDPLAPITEVGGGTIYPLQRINLWGYQFYTTQIPSQNVDIGSQKKQTIARILGNIKFPTRLTNDLAFAFVDPANVSQNDYLTIPWAGNKMASVYQVKDGGFQYVLNGGVIYINSTQNYNLNSILTHELGHRIGQQLTSEEWSRYYKLRGIPGGTPQQIENWALSPAEDFAEVYKHIMSGEAIKTNYGIFVPSGSFDTGECSILFNELTRKYLEKNPPAESYMYSVAQMEEAGASANIDPAVQKCRREKNGPGLFGGVAYVGSVDENTKKFIAEILTHLSEQ